MKIISFTGPKGSGKDTASALLVESGVSLGKISFAGPMKQMLSEIYSVPLSTFEDPELKEKPFEKPLPLDLSKLHEIGEGMLQMLPMDEFDYCYGFPIHAAEQTQLKSPRHMLQYVGTEVIRNNIHPDWHVAAAFRADVVDRLPNGIFNVTDARFVNEYEWLAQKFGKNFKGFYVERPEAEYLLSKATHQSELAVSEVRKLMSPSQILKNDGSVNDLKQTLFSKLTEGRSSWIKNLRNM